jgi:hypothetical protein
VEVGRVTRMESNHEEVSASKKGDEVAITFTPDIGAPTLCYGDHFDSTWTLCCRV